MYLNGVQRDLWVAADLMSLTRDIWRADEERLEAGDAPSRPFLCLQGGREGAAGHRPARPSRAASRRRPLRRNVVDQYA